MRGVKCSFLVLVLLAVPASLALAQHHGDEEPLLLDPVLAPLFMPAGDDFLPPPSDGQYELDPSLQPVGFGAFVDVGSSMKFFAFAPWYNVSPALKLKVRVPWIFQRSIDYWGTTAKAGGLGDIALEGEYARQLAGRGRALRLQGSVKLPTGDHEKETDDGLLVPLGTGSVDVLARAQYAQATARTGLLVTGIYRRNAAGERITQWIDEIDPTANQTTTTRQTNGHQFVGAVFARQRMTERLWLHLGAGLMLTGDGTTRSVTTYATDAPDWDSGDQSLLQKSTLLDLYPGFSWQFGKLSPYLGLRVPLVTSYADEFIEGDRKLAATLQVSYRPEKLF